VPASNFRNITPFRILEKPKKIQKKKSKPKNK